jgi:hypothetical protein
MSNKGLELLARTLNVDNDRVRWETTFTYTRNRNRVEELTIPAFTSASGYPTGSRRGSPPASFRRLLGPQLPDGRAAARLARAPAAEQHAARRDGGA